MNKMNELERHKTKDGKVLIIYQDETNDDSPRDWDNLGKMICFHRRYNLGDKTNLKSSDFNSLEELKQYIIKEYKAVMILPINMYEHSGISISVKSDYPYNDRWDSSSIGFIFATRETIEKEFGRKYITPKLKRKIKSILINEVETYNKYINGEVYGYKLFNSEAEATDEMGESEDSCWGYYDTQDILDEFNIANS
jgi:hypothetical protein